MEWRSDGVVELWLCKSHLGSFAVHLERGRDGVNEHSIGFQPVFRSHR